MALFKTDFNASLLVAGWIFPVIFIPRRLFDRLAAGHYNAVLAHEVARLARRDPLWNLVTGAIGGCFLLQPLNLVARRVTVEADLLADCSATRLLGRRMPLAGCLTSSGIQVARDGYPVCEFFQLTYSYSLLSYSHDTPPSAERVGAEFNMLFFGDDFRRGCTRCGGIPQRIQVGRQGHEHSQR